jgi:hypothetical protein
MDSESFDLDLARPPRDPAFDWEPNSLWPPAALSDGDHGHLGLETFDEPQTFKFDDEACNITPPPRFDSEFLQLAPLSPSHRRFDSQPSRVTPCKVRPKIKPGPVTEPSSTTPQALSFSKRSRGPRDISGAVDQEFLRLCLDHAITFNPHRLGFIPRDLWIDAEVKFGDLVTDFFQRKNNALSRFPHKLYNALKITASDPFYFDFLGVAWISETVLKVDKRVFAQLLGIKTVDGSLFHQQGNFPSHGFAELTPGEAERLVEKGELEGVDFDIIRLLVHHSRVFVRDASCEAIENCKWSRVKDRP